MTTSSNPCLMDHHLDPFSMIFPTKPYPPFMKSEDEGDPKKSRIFQLQKTTALHQAAAASRRPRTHGPGLTPSRRRRAVMGRCARSRSRSTSRP